jgi:protein-S-isoprenylcysteine O-methyltransferase Ste14
LFIGGLLGYRALRFSRVYGFSPICLPRADDRSAHAFLARLLLVCFGAVIALSAIATLWPDGLETLDPLYVRRHPALLGPGVALATFAAWLVWRGQDDMAASWRIGFPLERTELVTRGVFQFCRNPIYLGLLVALTAFCCLLPGYFSAGLLILAVVLLQVQARLEEDYLLRRHGPKYAVYCARFGRFLPVTGRWSAAATPAGPECNHEED